MKKTLSIFCTVALLLCSVMMPVSAANTNMKVTATLNGTTQPTVGADFTVNIVLSGNTDSTDADVYEWEGLCYGKLTVTFSDGLTLKSSALGDCMNSMATFKTAGKSPETIVYSDTLGHSGNGTLFTLTLNAATAGTYTITPVLDEAGDGNMDDLTIASEPLSITIAGADTPSAKTVTYSATNGKVIASLTELTEGTPVASGTLTTDAVASDDVYFYFFPDAGYTATGMTVNGSPTIGTDGARKFAVTTDTVFNFEFKPVSGTAAAPAAPTVLNQSADGVTIFGQATGASDFGVIVGNTTLQADGADGDGYFAIELTGTGIFAAAKTYAAKVYAGSAVSGATTFTID